MRKILDNIIGPACAGIGLAVSLGFLYIHFDTPTYKVNESETQTEAQYIEVGRDTVTTDLTQAPQVYDNLQIKTEPQFTYRLEEDEEQDLLKIAQAEASNQGIVGKALIMRVVLNRCEARVMSIHDVIRQDGQFTAYGNGHFDKAVSDAECEEALRMILTGWNESFDALYFESGSGETWHSRNLYYLFTYKDHKFYREKGE